MKGKFLSILAFAAFIVTLGLVQATHTYADVVDEVLTKSAQSDYEANFKLVQSYKGTKSGVTFESYSPAWKSVDQLKALEEELLQNKHGEELAYLGKVVIIPNMAAGSSTAGQYFASYQWSDQEMSLETNRVIYLFDGDTIKTVEGFARILSHEYGHHFTYYQLINRENHLPNNWKSSGYVVNRAIKSDSRINYTHNGEWQWMIQEIMAEDYVQLFGSEKAISKSMHRNTSIPTPFEVPTLQEYWGKYLPGYAPKSKLSIYLKGYSSNIVDLAHYNLEILMKNLQNKKTYLVGGQNEKLSVVVPIDQITGNSEIIKWYYFNGQSQITSWLFEGNVAPQIRLAAIQHEPTGLNRGSKPLIINYKNINASVSTDEQIFRDTYKDPKTYTIAEIKTMLREVSIQNGIPPEILKAIAYIETRFAQFDGAGNPNIAPDGGIGMMQITLSDAQLLAQGIDKEMLKWNTRYNIEMGAKILKEKWNNANLPKINDKNPNVIENWYFAIMAYNGLSKRNDPTLTHNILPYQERVLEAIRNNGLLPISTIPTVKITYPFPETPDIMAFPEHDYNWPTIGTKSAQMWAKGQTVYTLNNQLDFSRLRDGVNGKEFKQLKHYTPLEIVSGPYEVDANQNHFAMYEVQMNGVKGFIASSNLRAGEFAIFDGIQDEELVSALTYLQLKNLIDSKTAELFNPNTPILRADAAKMLVKELGLTLPAGYKMKATDMKPGEANYQEMMIAEAHGILGMDGTIRPNGNLTRAQMAAILVRAYDKLYAKPTTSVTFTDVAKTNWSYNDINTLAFNRITITAGGSFKPNN